MLMYAVVTPNVRPTGATLHAGVPTASALAVARHDSRPDEYYLFYLDANGRVMTDTWHESVDRALEQAAFEYEDLSWTTVSA